MISGTYKGKVSVQVDGQIMCECEVNGEAHYKEVIALLMQRFVMLPYEIVSDLESWAMPKVDEEKETPAETGVN